MTERLGMPPRRGRDTSMLPSGLSSIPHISSDGSTISMAEPL